MKLFSVIVVRIDSKPSQILSAEYDLTSFGYFQRGRQVDK
jgi:hypothetical protein